MVELIENILNKNRIKNPNLYFFKTLKEELENEGFIFKGLNEEIECYSFENENGLNLNLYPVLFYPKPDYFHLFNWSLSY